MDLSNLQPAKGSTKKKKRIGRGVGSGYGGHSSTKGNKGQKSRAGASIPAWFEGGQMPLQRRLPKFGFKNPFRKEFRAINLGRLQEMLDSGQIDPSEAVTHEVLMAHGMAQKKDLYKILGGGDINASLTIHAHAFSASARKKIEQAGGTANVIE